MDLSCVAHYSEAGSSFAMPAQLNNSKNWSAANLTGELAWGYFPSYVKIERMSLFPHSKCHRQIRDSLNRCASLRSGGLRSIGLDGALRGGMPNC